MTRISIAISTGRIMMLTAPFNELAKYVWFKAESICLNVCIWHKISFYHYFIRISSPCFIHHLICFFSNLSIMLFLLHVIELHKFFLITFSFSLTLSFSLSIVFATLHDGTKSHSFRNEIRFNFVWLEK